MPVFVVVHVFEADFFETPNISRQVTMTTDEPLTVSLPATPNTGFLWSEQTMIGDTSILQQVGHVPSAASTPPVTVYGAPEEWVFKALKAGTTTVSMDYSRNGEAGAIGGRTFKLTVTVK